MKKPLKGRCLLLLVHTRLANQASQAHAGVDTLNYAISCTTKMEAKFPYCDQIKFNELVLKPGTPE